MASESENFITYYLRRAMESQEEREAQLVAHLEEVWFLQAAACNVCRDFSFCEYSRSMILLFSLVRQVLEGAEKLKKSWDEPVMRPNFWKRGTLAQEARQRKAEAAANPLIPIIEAFRNMGKSEAEAEGQKKEKPTQ